MRWSREAQVGISIGLAIGVVGILLALPNLSDAYRIYTTVSENAWPNLVTNFVPLLLLVVVGSLAAGRGLRPAWTGMFAGFLYGLMQGLTLYLIAVLNGNKRALADKLWAAYVRSGYADSSHARPLVTQSVLHPNIAAYLLDLTAQMVVLGLIMGWLGGLLNRKPRPNRTDTPSPR